MNSVRRTSIARCTIATFLLFAAVGCDEQNVMAPDTTIRPAAQISRLRVTADLVTLVPGQTAEIHLAAASSGNENRLVWTSDDSLIADVDKTGLIVARSVGTTTITVSEAGKLTDVLVTVVPADSGEAGQ